MANLVIEAFEPGQSLVNSPDSLILQTRCHIRSLDVLPRRLADSFNEGDRANLKRLLHSYMSDSCKFTLCRPSSRIEKHGVLYMYEFYDHLATARPDCVHLIRRVSRLNLKKGYAIRCKVHVSGTLSGLQSPSTTFGKTPTSAMDFVDRNKFSRPNVEAIRQAENIILDRKDLPHVYLNGLFDYFVDEDINKIVAFRMKLSLSSIRGVPK